ncbi:MAG: sulfatase, partial [Candidatus Methylomirabilales bacterium]
NYISPGESPFFQWIRTHITAFLWLGLAYLVLTSMLQYVSIRGTREDFSHALTALVGIEFCAVGMLAYAFQYGSDAFVGWGHTLLQTSLLLQVYVILWRFRPSTPHPSAHIDKFRDNDGAVFLSSLFFFAALPVFVDPSWQRLQQYTQLDSSLEVILSQLFPAVLSGVTGVWFGIGILVLLAGVTFLSRRLAIYPRLRRCLPFLPFLSIAGLYAAVFLTSLAYAIAWELRALRLDTAIVPLFILLAGGGGAIGYSAFQRIAPHTPRNSEYSLIGMIALSVGAALVFPITWLVTRRGCGRWTWRLVLASSLLAPLLLGYSVVYADLFNPWYTVFSYLKSAMLKIAAVIAAGIQVLIFEELRPADSARRVATKGRWMMITVTAAAGLLPFTALEQYREIKAAMLETNEFSIVDTTHARALSDLVGVGRWIRLGQNPQPNHHQEPWPLPWTLKKTGPSLLPENFNVIVIVVDALRGDAFHSAGYHRNLTPFLDQWAHQEAISFRRAYTQGGGTFAAFPFLVAGRSRFTMYGPHLQRENLYFKLAQAEGIEHVMVVKEFGPRAIFPPDFPIIELVGSRPASDQHSVPADEVFGWAQDAIAKLPQGDRFLAFLHLMDVHNDLWKKADGIDFGDTLRDLYDNNLSYVDRAFRRFVTWLKDHGIYDRTVILLTSDHGEQFWEHGASLHGHTLYEEEIRIPLILLAHGIRGRVEDVPVVAADMAPTIAELAGYSIDPPYNDPHMGISLLPLLLGKERDRYLNRDIVGRASFKRRYFLYRNWEWKLVYSAEFDLLQLFNTVKDPSERRNMLQEERELAAALECELLGYLERVEGKSYQKMLSKTS